MVRLTEDMIVARTRVRLFESNSKNWLKMKILKGERHEPREETQLLGSRTVRYLHHKVGCYSMYKCQSVVFSNIFLINHCCIDPIQETWQRGSSLPEVRVSK